MLKTTYSAPEKLSKIITDGIHQNNYAKYVLLQSYYKTVEKIGYSSSSMDYFSVHY